MRSAPLLLFPLTIHTSWKVILLIYLIVTWATYSGNDVPPKVCTPRTAMEFCLEKKSVQMSLRILRQCCPGLFKYDLSLLNRYLY